MSIVAIVGSIYVPYFSLLNRLGTNLEFDYDQELSRLNYPSSGSDCAMRADTPRFHYH